MKMLPLGCVLGLGCLFSLGCSALAQDAAPVDTRVLTETLKQIKEKRAAAEKTMEGRAVADIQAAASSNAAAIAFYENAIAATQYDGKDHDRAEFQDWKKDHADELKSDAVQSAVRLHLSYLLLTLQRAKGATTQQLEPALLAHIAAVLAAGAGDVEIQRKRDKMQEMKDAGIKPPGGQGKKPSALEPLFWTQDMIIKQGVTSSLFVDWYGIQKLFTNLKDWDPIPGNIDGMYQATLLPYYREKKDARVLAYWDGKMQKEAQEASNTGLTFKIDKFNLVRRPQLLWKRAGEMLTIGQRNRAIGEMFGLIKSYPDHPDQPAWISQLEGMIAPPAAVSGSASGVAAPAASTASAPRAPGDLPALPASLQTPAPH